MGKGNQVWKINRNIKIEVKYKGNSQRPTIFKVEYEINGKRNIRRILNK